MINKQNKNHHRNRYLHKRIPDIIIEPQKQQTKNPKDNDVNDNIIPILITKNKHKIT